MHELSNSFGSATCAICNRVCDLTTCTVNEEGLPVHEHCYTSRLHKTAQNDQC